MEAPLLPPGYFESLFALGACPFTRTNICSSQLLFACLLVFVQNGNLLKMRKYVRSSVALFGVNAGKTP